MPRLDLTPAPIRLPGISPPEHGRGPVEWFDRPTPDRRGPQGVLVVWRDLAVWLTREALLEAVPQVLASKIREDRLAAEAWIVRDTAAQVDDVRRVLRERRGGAQ